MHGKAVQKNTGSSKNGSVELIQMHVHQGSPFPSIVAKPPQSSLCCPRPPSQHPAEPRSPSYPPSTYFHHQHSSSGNTVLIHSFQMHKPSQYSLICSTR